MDAPDDAPDAAEALALEGLLRWYAAMGVDALIDEAPHDRFVSPPPAVSSDASSAPRVSRDLPERSAARQAPPPVAGVSQSAEALVAQAAELAAAAVDLDDLRARWEAVPGCRLGASSRMIFASAPASAPLMIVGGAPNEDDERAGEIFAGPAGRLLDAMLRAIGLDRAGVALGHVVPWRPPGNRAPTPLELALSLPFCRRQIALVQPRLLLCLGERAAQPLLGSRDPLSRLRGRWLTFEGEARTVKALVTFSPDYLLKQPGQKRRAWADLLVLEAEFRPQDP